MTKTLTLISVYPLFPGEQPFCPAMETSWLWPAGDMQAEAACKKLSKRSTASSFTSPISRQERQV